MICFMHFSYGAVPEIRYFINNIMLSWFREIIVLNKNVQKGVNEIVLWGISLAIGPRVFLITLKLNDVIM